MADAASYSSSPAQAKVASSFPVFAVGLVVGLVVGLFIGVVVVPITEPMLHGGAVTNQPSSGGGLKSKAPRGPDMPGDAPAGTKGADPVAPSDGKAPDEGKPAEPKPAEPAPAPEKKPETPKN